MTRISVWVRPSSRDWCAHVRGVCACHRVRATGVRECARSVRVCVYVFRQVSFERGKAGSLRGLHLLDTRFLEINTHTHTHTHIHMQTHARTHKNRTHAHTHTPKISTCHRERRACALLCVLSQPSRKASRLPAIQKS